VNTAMNFKFWKKSERLAASQEGSRSVESFNFDASLPRMLQVLPIAHSSSISDSFDEEHITGSVGFSPTMDWN
jgi:hypothetical protein